MQPGTCRCPQPLKIWHLQSDSALAQCKGGGSLAAAGRSTQPAPSWQHAGDSSLCQLGGTSLPWVCGSSRVNRRVRMGLSRVLPGRTVARSAGKGLLVLPVDRWRLRMETASRRAAGHRRAVGCPWRGSALLRTPLPRRSCAALGRGMGLSWHGAAVCHAALAGSSCPHPRGQVPCFLQGGLSKGEPCGAVTPPSGRSSSCSHVCR